MTVNYNVPGNKRKQLALTIAKWTGHEVKYLGAPTFAYQVGCFTIDKNGTLTFDSGLGGEVVERLLEHLHNEGFELEDFSNETTSEAYSEEDIEEMLIEQRLEEQEEMGIIIQIPKEHFDEKALQNLSYLLCNLTKYVIQYIVMNIVPSEPIGFLPSKMHNIYYLLEVIVVIIVLVFVRKLLENKRIRSKSL